MEPAEKILTGYDKSIDVLRDLFTEAGTFISGVSLSHIQFWHAQVRGKLIVLFPKRPEIIEHWNSIDFEWDDRREFYAAFSGTDYQSNYSEDSRFDYPNSYEDYCWYRIKWCQDALLEYVSILSAENTKSGDVEGDKSYSEAFLETRPSIPDFGFIDNRHSRDLLKIRMEQALVCFENRIYLPGVVLIGSALEGMLLGLVQDNWEQAQNSKCAPKNEAGKWKNFNEWSFEELINVAHDIGWMKDEGQRWAKELQGWRNFIHPSVELKNNKASVKNPNATVILGKDHLVRGFTAVNHCISELHHWLAEGSDVSTADI